MNILNIILDSNIYELADCQIGKEDAELKHFKYFSNIIDFVKEKQHNKVICSSEEFEAISNMHNHPWNQYGAASKSVTQYNALPILFNLFLKLIDYDKLTTNELLPAKPLVEIRHCSLNNEQCYKEFLKHISNSNECIVFMGTANHNLPTPLQFEVNNQIIEIEPIMDIENENVIYFSNGFRKWLMIENHISPSLKKPLPNIERCKNYESLQKRMLKDGYNAKEVYRKIVKEVALRNGYIKDNEVSAYNSSKSHIRDIYNSQTKPIVYISADVEHGCIEVCNNKGKHQGEYTYCGERRTPPDKTGHHDIMIP